jgi:ankyrin repeat protein
MAALMQAVSAGDASKVRAMAESGFDLSASDGEGYTPLGLAAHLGRLEIVEIILSYPVEVDYRLQDGATALILAVAAGHESVALRLLDAGAAVDLQTENGVTALMLAAAMNLRSVVEKLLAKGADPNREDAVGNTALVGAVVLGKMDALEALLSGAKDLSVSARAVTEACALGDVAIFDRLVDKGGDVNAHGRGGGTCLMLAVWNGERALVERAISRGVDVKAAVEGGWTALMTAVAASNGEMVKILLDKGADPRRSDQQKRTALSIAASNGEVEIHALLSASAGLPPGNVAPRTHARLLTQPLACPFDAVPLSRSGQSVTLITPVIWHPADAAKRWGQGLKRFSEVRSSKAVPVEVCRPFGEAQYLKGLACEGGESPFETLEGVKEARAGSVGKGGRCGNLVDLFIVHCPEASYKIYMDMYNCTVFD